MAHLHHADRLRIRVSENSNPSSNIVSESAPFTAIKKTAATLIRQGYGGQADIYLFDDAPRAHSCGARRGAPVHLAPLDSVLAYQAVQVIRRKLKERGINESWATLREKLARQYRITATFKQRDGKTLHIRQATRPEEELGEIYTKLGIASDPGGLQKMTI